MRSRAGMIRLSVRSRLAGLANIVLVLLGLAGAGAGAGAGQAATAVVYRGPGACDEGCWAAAAAVAEAQNLEVRYVGPEETDPDLFKNAVVWLQPGGLSAVVQASMTPALKERLQAFVRDGGGYVGFCAGGFFGSRIFHTLNADGQDQAYQGLGFFDGESYLYSKSDDAMILKMSWAGTTRYLYWEGGPYFAAKGVPQTETLATYPDGRAGMIQAAYGKGRAALSGVHPEAPEDWRTDAGLNDPDGLDLDLAADMLRRVTRMDQPTSGH